LLNRREIAAGAGAVALVSLAGASAQTPAAPEFSRATRALYRRALVVDGNISPPVYGELPFSKERLDAALAAGVTTGKVTFGGYNANFEDTVAEIAFWQRAVETHPDALAQVRQAADIAAAKRAGKIGIIFSFEGVDMLEGKLDRIELFRNLGVRVMQLSYNMTSPFGAGVLAPPEAGLTDLGRQAIAQMNRTGIALDLSHANPATTSAAFAASTKPVLITHGGCAAVHPHPRNKSDAQLRALAEKGGVFGIYDLFYLAPSPRQPTLDDYMAHMTHALSVCGEDHVGIGSDTDFISFDTSPGSLAAWNEALARRRAAGVAAPEEDRAPYVIGLNRADRCQVIADALLRRNYPARVAEKILGANFVRAFSEIW
jgi:membrane dipeptidase